MYLHQSDSLVKGKEESEGEEMKERKHTTHLTHLIHLPDSLALT